MSTATGTDAFDLPPRMRTRKGMLKEVRNLAERRDIIASLLKVGDITSDADRIAFTAALDKVHGKYQALHAEETAAKKRKTEETKQRAAALRAGVPSLADPTTAVTNAEPD